MLSFPPLYVVASLRRAPICLFALYLIFCTVGVLIFAFTGHLNMAAYIPCFLAGVPSYALRHRVRVVLPSSLWVSSLLIFIAIFVFYTQPGEEPPSWSGWIFYLFLGFTINLYPDSTNLPINFAADRMAVYSYGIYLPHMPVLSIVFQRIAIQNLIDASLLFLSRTAAAVSACHLIELPCINLRRSLSSGELRHAVSEAAALSAAP